LLSKSSNSSPANRVNIVGFVGKTELKQWVVPLCLLFLSILSFGVFIPYLGFFWDDWPLILTGKFQGLSGFWPYWQYDRPYAAITYMISYFLCGDNPLLWQIFTLLLRWSTTVTMWWALS
jgi:hypothetical protein